jgi:dolichol kinase
VLVRSWYPLFSNTADYASVFQPKFLDLAFGAALAIFLALEIIRVSC